MTYDTSHEPKTRTLPATGGRGERSPAVGPQPAEAPADSDARFRAFVTASSDVVFSMSPDWSEMRYLQGKGFLADTPEPSATWLDTYVHPQDRKRVSEAIQRAIRDKRVFEHEHRVRRADGTPGWTLSRAVPILDERGEIVEWLGAARDITERKRAEEWQRENDEHQACLLALADALRPLADPVEIEGRATRILGEHLGADRAFYVAYDDTQDAGTVSRDYVAADRPSLAGHYPTARYPAALGRIRTGRTWPVPDASTDPDLSPDERDALVRQGLVAWIDVPLVKREKLVSVLCVTQSTPRAWTEADIRLVEDVAERLWAAIERARAEASLRHSEERLQLSLNASGMGTFVWYPEDDRGEPDARALQLFGRPAHERSISLRRVFQTIIHPEDLAWYRASVTRALDPDGSGVLREDFRVVHPDSSIHWLSIYGNVSFGGDPPRAERMVGLMMDITDRKDAEAERERLLAEVREQKNRAEDALQMRDEFLSIAAHELRNPVTTIKATGQLMQRTRAKGRVDPRRDDRYIRTISETADHLKVLIDDLLDVSRLRSGQLPIHTQPVDLARIIMDAVEIETIFVAKPRLRLDIRDGHTLSLDPERIRQVIVNLLDNAIKYSPDGGEVHIQLEYDPQGALLRVTDQGIGMPAGSLEAIFEPFGRATNAALSNIQGMGLGLYIARRIVEAHGGRLWAESEGESQGTTVSMWLPASPDDERFVPPT